MVLDENKVDQKVNVSVSDLELRNQSTDVVSILEDIKNLPVFKEEDIKFLVEHKQHLNTVLERTHMWRTDTQKLHILNDIHHPTLHGKFHQAILEQKVQFEQSLYLAKDYELKRIEIEELELQLQEAELENNRNISGFERLELEKEIKNKKHELNKRKIQVEMQFKMFELKEMRIAMDYRMKEVKGWQDIIRNLKEELEKQGLSEDVIWNKDAGDFMNLFFYGVNLAIGLDDIKDSGEKSNILAMLQFGIQNARKLGILEDIKKSARPDQLAVIEKYEKVF